MRAVAKDRWAVAKAIPILHYATSWLTCAIRSVLLQLDSRSIVILLDSF